MRCPTAACDVRSFRIPNDGTLAAVHDDLICELNKVLSVPASDMLHKAAVRGQDERLEECQPTTERQSPRCIEDLEG